MKFLAVLFASVLLRVGTASAQVPSPSSTSSISGATQTPDPATSTATSGSAEAAGTPPQGDVVGVFEHYDFHAYVGYTIMRFYEAPYQIETRNGFDGSLVYYYQGGVFAADGELMASFGSQFNESSHFLFGGAGPRFRWSGRRNIEFWGHGLVGESHYTPQTALGPQGAFGYELGLGADALAAHRRLAYRLELDMLGTHFFGTYQYSPKASIGLVWKF